MSSQPWSVIDPTVDLEDNDSLMLLLAGETGVNANKRATLATLKSFIGVTTVGQSAATLGISSEFDPPIAAIAFDNNIIFGPGIIDRTSEEDGVFQLTGGIFQLTSSIALNGATSSLMRSQWRRADDVAFTTGDLLIGTISKIVNSISIELLSNAPGSAVTIDARTQDVFVRLDIIQDDGPGELQIEGTWGQIVSVGSGALTEFTWGASDEDSPLITGIQYVTEIASANKSIDNIIISLKNAPTGGIVVIDIEQETIPNQNDFNGNSIFSTLPQIEIGEFFNAVAPVITTPFWNADRRLRILVTTNDTNFVATGLKVSLF